MSGVDELPGGDIKIGGHSVYLYAGSLAGLVLVYMYWTRRSQAQTAANAAPVNGQVTPDLTANPLPPSDGSTNTTTGATATNATWEVEAITYLVTQGVPPTAAQSAIQRYFYGEALDYQQTTYINKAIAKYGPPPEGLSGEPNVTNTPPPVAGAPTPQGARWTIRRQVYLTAGPTMAYLKPDVNFPNHRGATKGGTKVTTVRYANINGIWWAMTPGGFYYNTGELQKVSG